MISLLIDAVVLIGMVMALNQDSESPPFLRAVAAAFAIGILTVAAVYWAAAALGLVGVLLALVGIAVIAGLVLWLVFDVPPPRAAIGGIIFLVYKVVISVFWAFMFSTPSS